MQKQEEEEQVGCVIERERAIVKVKQWKRRKEIENAGGFIYTYYAYQVGKITIENCFTQVTIEN